jgi:hypothetical protein
MMAAQTAIFMDRQIAAELPNGLKTDDRLMGCYQLESKPAPGGPLLDL